MSSRIATATAFAFALCLTGAASASEGRQGAGTLPAEMLMSIGNPHDASQAAARKRAEADRRLEERRRQELAEWTGRHSRDVFPNMGLGNSHAPQR